jgi:TolB-like protein/Flp pilus assembly protein TadD
LVLRSHANGSAGAEPSVAVLPFEDIDGDNATAAFANGIHDDVLVDLSKVAAIKVISRDSVMQYRGTARDLREIGNALGANAVLEGNVHREGERARVNVQLIKAADGVQLWAENFERPISDAFGMENEIALRIVEALRAKVSSAEVARVQNAPTKSSEAYRRFVEARSMYTDYQKLRPDLDKAERLYQEAVALDPNFALAYAHLSQLENVYFSMYDQTAERREKARAAAREALRLQPDLPEAHVALGLDYWRANVSTGEIDYEKALAEFAFAQRGLPNDADIYESIGRIQRNQGKWAESTENLKKAASLDPNSLERWHRLCGSYEITHKFPEAEEALERVIALAPPSRRWRYRLHRAYLHMFWKGDLNEMAQLPPPPPDDAEGRHTEEMASLKIFLRQYDEAEKIVRDDTNDTLDGAPKSFVLGQICYLRNDVAKASAAFETACPVLEAAVQAKPRDAIQRFRLAETYASLGRKAEAIREAKRAAEIIPESRDAYNGLAMQCNLAHIYVMVGEIDRALPIIEHALATPGWLFRNEIRLDPNWDALRPDPRFERIVAEAPDPLKID